MGKKLILELIINNLHFQRKLGIMLSFHQKYPIFIFIILEELVLKFIKIIPIIKKKMPIFIAVFDFLIKQLQKNAKDNIASPNKKNNKKSIKNWVPIKNLNLKAIPIVVVISALKNTKIE